MRAYHVTIDASGLAIPDGPTGFAANRFVVASTPSAAKALAVRKTLQAWTLGHWKGVSSRLPEAVATHAEEVGLIRLLSGLRQNRAHNFYDEE